MVTAFLRILPTLNIYQNNRASCWKLTFPVLMTLKKSVNSIPTFWVSEKQVSDITAIDSFQAITTGDLPILTLKDFSDASRVIWKL